MIILVPIHHLKKSAEGYFGYLFQRLLLPYQQPSMTSEAKPPKTLGALLG
jgi:hypothetical protein